MLVTKDEWMLTRFSLGIISQYIQITNPYVVSLKLTKRFMSIIVQLKKRKFFNKKEMEKMRELFVGRGKVN